MAPPLPRVTISHDRYFLESVALEIAEINPAYPTGILRTRGNYSRFLEDKEAFLEAQQRRQEALENRVRTEIEWLRRGPKARATKAKARIDNAHALIGQLAEVTARNRTATADIEFTESGRESKRLVTLDHLAYEIAGRTLFRNLTFPLTAGTRVGLVGPNGSGKTTILRLLRGELEPTSGIIERANALRVVYFDQNRQLDPSLTLRRALAPDSDSVIYQDRVIHVASWASRFLFTSEQLNQPVANLSGGERARVLIAKLMLEPADLLLLDEPTNDLDISTLEILEESLLEFRGALVLVTHDRYLLDRVSTVVLGLDGNGNAGQFADYLQWEAWRDELEQERGISKRSVISVPAPSGTPSTRKKLSYLEAREYETIEARIAEAESTLRQAQTVVEDPSIASDAARLQTALNDLSERAGRNRCALRALGRARSEDQLGLLPCSLNRLAPRRNIRARSRLHLQQQRVCLVRCSDAGMHRNWRVTWIVRVVGGVVVADLPMNNGATGQHHRTAILIYLHPVHIPFRNR